MRKLCAKHATILPQHDTVSFAIMGKEVMEYFCSALQAKDHIQTQGTVARCYRGDWVYLAGYSYGQGETVIDVLTRQLKRHVVQKV